MPASRRTEKECASGRANRGRRHESQNAEGGERGGYATGKALNAPAQTFAHRQGPDKAAALDCGMNLAPVDVEFVGIAFSNS